MHANARGYIAALIATAIWSGNFIVARGVADAIPPIQLSFWRWLLASICVIPLAWPYRHTDIPVIRSNIKYLIFMGIFGVALLNTLIYKAGQTTDSINMGLLLPTAPVIILVLARILFGEPITWRRLCALVVVLLGVFFLVSRGSWENVRALHFAAGDLWALGGVVSFAVYSLYTRQKPVALSSAGFNAVTFIIGVLLLVPVTLVEMYMLPAPTWDWTVLVGIVYAGVGCSFIAYLLWTYAISSIGPVGAGMVYYTIPLFVAVEGVYILGETILWAHIVGGLLIVTGIITATMPTKTRY